MGKLALIDGDMVAHRSAASCQPSKIKAANLGVPFEELQVEPVDLAILRADELLYRILSESQAEKHRIFLGGSENFRELLDPNYKANRRTKPSPVWLDAVRDFLVREWGAEICAGYEADDGIGIAAKGDFVICSNDHDFRQIPGEIYNPINLEFEVVDDETAAYNFFAHMLIGDSGDNVRGVDGIGPKKSRQHLAGRSPEEMYSTVRGLYADDERFLRNFRLLRILREEHEYEDILREIKGTPTPEDGGGMDSENVSEAHQE